MLLGCAIASHLLLCYGLPLGVPYYKTYLHAVAFLVLILGLSAFSWTPLVNRVTRWLGELSYSLYLNHPTLIRALARVYAVIMGAAWLRSPFSDVAGGDAIYYGLTFGISFAVTVIALLLISVFSYRYIERPGMQLGEQIIRRLGQPSRVQLSMLNRSRSRTGRRAHMPRGWTR